MRRLRASRRPGEWLHIQCWYCPRSVSIEAGIWQDVADLPGGWRITGPLAGKTKGRGCEARNKHEAGRRLCLFSPRLDRRDDPIRPVVCQAHARYRAAPFIPASLLKQCRKDLGAAFTKIIGLDQIAYSHRPRFESM